MGAHAARAVSAFVERGCEEERQTANTSSERKRVRGRCAHAYERCAGKQVCLASLGETAGRKNPAVW